MNKLFLNTALLVSVSFWGAPTLANLCESHFKKSEVQSLQVQNYLKSTLKSFESMRGENGLVRDTIRVRTNRKKDLFIQTLNDKTSPTNIAIDLLINGELAQNPTTSTAAYKTISKILATLSKVKFHEDTGLFFTRYSTDISVKVTDYSVSSIDNFHLALALWTIKEKMGGTEMGRQANQLFDRMDFSVYLENDSKLIGGNLRHQNGQWIREEYNFANFGSEARALYSAGYALGLFKKHHLDEADVRMAISSTKAEVLQTKEGPILKLWDGSAFQLFFPKIFVGEENYSSTLRNIFVNAGNYMVNEGARRGLSVPASHSAVRAGIRDGGNRPLYQDKAGNKDLVSSDNRDVTEPHLAGKWESVFTPYALFMAATANPNLLSHFSKIENVKSGINKFYTDEMGWMDGLHVESDLKGQVVPAQISLNQGMLALSLLELQAADGMSLSARAIFENPETRARMNIFYKHFDGKLKHQINPESK